MSEHEMREIFKNMPPEQQDVFLDMLQALYDSGSTGSKESAKRARTRARQVAFAMDKRRKRDADNVTLDEDVYGELRSLFDDEGDSDTR
ncbi:hypothetical protein GC175_08420 [bacterium]|nr:hypothetical protein [bacterium]